MKWEHKVFLLFTMLSNMPESTTFATGSKMRMWYFRPGYDEIVYYAPREEETWTVYISCKYTRCGMANFTPVERILFFTISWPKVPLSLPAPKRKCSIFGPSMMKNRIRNMGVKRATPEHMFATLAFGSGGNLHVLWTSQLFTALVV